MKKYTVTVNESGTRRWYNEAGQLHREDGPAIEYEDGYKAWWINGKRHREDGPAVEYASGTKSWYINGQSLSEQEFNERMNPVVELTVAEIEKIVGKKVKIVK